MKKDVIRAVAAVRVSSTKQGLTGDSPAAQKELIKRHSNQVSLVFNRPIEIIKWFEFIESASGELEQQPIQKAIEYCKEKNNKISLFFFKSIDRFTRGGSSIYAALKSSLARYGVQMIDTYGVISQQQINTMEQYGLKYEWSTYSPSWISEMLEAERAHSDVRDILSRLIGAEVYYTRLGYLAREAPMGFKRVRIDTPHGKRLILESHGDEFNWFILMFELRAAGNLSDEQVTDKVNDAGFKTRIRNIHDKLDKRKIIGTTGGNKLTIKQLQRYIQNPIYAGVICEKWTNYQPVKAQFKGLVSVELFNRANRGKKKIVIEGDKAMIITPETKGNTQRLKLNPDYPYKQQVLCPFCNRELMGSSPRSKSGKHIPTYHCGRNHKYWGINKSKFDTTIEQFVSQIHFSKGFRSKFEEIVLEEWEKRRSQTRSQSISFEEQIISLKQEAQMITDKIKILNSETAIRAMESELEKIDLEIANIQDKRNRKEKEELNTQTVINYCKFYMEHLEELILRGDDTLKNAAMFGLLFEKRPTYFDLVNRTPELAPIVELNDTFEEDQNQLVTPQRFELEFE
ncbi:hypothetical protein A3H19_01445 [Candidatus Woesebacteria bacterium RIFCSPLOWO2_12_FULL_39_9]|nr:MAG: hypothetical protein A3H19_01445 [Candidatus Woesebacteria bacterium RIFCSPLOWO2_12_FULL_39_9]